MRRVASKGQCVGTETSGVPCKKQTAASDAVCWWFVSGLGLSIEFVFLASSIHCVRYCADSRGASKLRRILICAEFEIFFALLKACLFLTFLLASSQFRGCVDCIVVPVERGIGKYLEGNCSILTEELSRNCPVVAEENVGRRCLGRNSNRLKV